jgi:hypothetical protein
MIISNFRSNNPISFYRNIIIRIHDSASDLRMTFLDLSDFIESQKIQFEQLREQLTQEFFKIAAKYANSVGKCEISEK